MTAPYPTQGSARTHWIMERRGPRNVLRADRPYAVLAEEEAIRPGRSATVATVFLTNRECPWKCVMCDLWRNTTAASLQPGQIPAQIRFALGKLPHATILKLYNSGSFFDPGAIPKSDWAEIVQLCSGFKRVVVECHPRLIGPAVLEFANRLGRPLEVALGLETAHREALEALNKRSSVPDFQKSALVLKQNGLRLRTFLLINPPFIPDRDQTTWLRRSLEVAQQCQSDVISLIPLRAGNGAIDELLKQGAAREPTLDEIETAQELALAGNPALTFCDTWDLQRFASCRACLEPRAARIHQMNLSQSIQPRVPPCA